MEGTSVLAKNKKEAPDKKETKTASGEQNVLGGTVKEHSSVSFYKQAWFWIILAVIVLGVAGLVVFLIINASSGSSAIEKYDSYVGPAKTTVDEFESSFSNIYSESGLSGYYTQYSATDRMKELHNKCLEKFGADDSIIKTANEIADTYLISGELYAEEHGIDKTREIAENAEKVASIYKDAKKDISQCKDILKDALDSDVEISFGEFTVTEGRWTDDTELKVTIKNKGDTSHSFSFRVEAQDKDGNKITDESVYTKTLSAGEETEEKVFEYVYGETIDKLKSAKFVVKKLSEN